MEERLGRLFDYQHFEREEELQTLVEATERRYPAGILRLSEEDLRRVAAAGPDYPELNRNRDCKL